MRLSEVIKKYQNSEVITNLPRFVPCQCGDNCYVREDDGGDGGLFWCWLCKRDVPFCFAAADDFYDLCDNCAAVAVEEIKK